MVLNGGGQLVEELADSPAVQGPEMAGEPDGGDRLGLGQVVSLGLVGQLCSHHIEGCEVWAMVLGPADPDPHQRPRGEVDTGCVF
jgi:hypothetical protein